MKSILGTSSDIWLLTHYSDTSNTAWGADSAGGLWGYGYVASYASGIVPVLSLSSELGIESESGDGSSSNPYKLNA